MVVTSPVDRPAVLGAPQVRLSVSLEPPVVWYADGRQARPLAEWLHDGWQVIGESCLGGSHTYLLQAPGRDGGWQC